MKQYIFLRNYGSILKGSILTKEHNGSSVIQALGIGSEIYMSRKVTNDVLESCLDCVPYVKVEAKT